MKGRNWLLALMGLVVLALLGAIWPLTHRVKAAYRLEVVRETKEMATDLENTQASADANLRLAARLEEATRQLRAPVATEVADLFISRSAEPTSVAGVDWRTLLPNTHSASDPANAGDDPPQQTTYPGNGSEEGDPPAFQMPALTLVGLVRAGEQPMAVINTATSTEVKRPGSEIAGLRIVDIDSDSVLLLSPYGQRSVLVLQGWQQQKEIQ